LYFVSCTIFPKWLRKVSKIQFENVICIFKSIRRLLSTYFDYWWSNLNQCVSPMTSARNRRHKLQHMMIMSCIREQWREERRWSTSRGKNRTRTARCAWRRYVHTAIPPTLWSTVHATRAGSYLASDISRPAILSSRCCVYKRTYW